MDAAEVSWRKQGQLLKTDIAGAERGQHLGKKRGWEMSLQ